MSYMTIDQVTAFCMSTTKGGTAEDRNLFVAWCVAAMQSIGPDRDWYKTEVMYPKDFSFRKPSDLVSTVSIALYDDTDQELRYNFHTGSQRIHIGRYYPTTQLLNFGHGVIDLSEDAHYFHMSSNATEVAYGLIRYLAMPLDQEGMPLIPEQDLLAYEAFCSYMVAKREKNSQSEIAQMYDIWLRERDRVKGRRKMPNGSEAEMIAQSWLSLINAPLTKLR